MPPKSRSIAVRGHSRTKSATKPKKKVVPVKQEDDEWESAENESSEETDQPAHNTSNITVTQVNHKRPPSSMSTREYLQHPLLGSNTSPSTPLAPLTSLHRSDEMSTSPESTSDISYERQRRSSLYSIPIQSSTSRDTSSTFSFSPGARSSLTALPTTITTRPPSPYTAYASPSLNSLISFFPPVNPHATIESIHPLLPHPYLANHLTVLSKRVPVREALDRVWKAKQGVGK